MLQYNFARKQEYYAHPRNHFGKIIFTLLSLHRKFDQKIKVLQQNDIGLDVFTNAKRKGSLDIHIKNHKENDFTLFAHSQNK
jgi:hypoxanthine-DNA glycosylase